MTTIEGGTVALAVTGSINGTSSIDVRRGATFDVACVLNDTVNCNQTLKGNGAVQGAKIIIGTVSQSWQDGDTTYVWK